MEKLIAKDITKVFPGVIALNKVNLTLETGQVHCICGENGAGKSTLIKCLTGVYVPEEGDVLIDGKSVKEDSKLFDKVAYVPQEIDLFDYLTVAENLFMPFSKSGIKGLISQRDLVKKAKPVLEKFNINLKGSELVKDISVSQKQLLQIARATMFEHYEILLLDEPTTSLTTEDTEKLFSIIRDLKNENKCIVFISHKLEEVFEIGDVLTIFRNGENAGHMKVNETDIAGTIVKMTGHRIDDDEILYSENVQDEVLLEVDHLTGEVFRDISFTLKKGEILGFAGLVGAGRSEVMQAVFGYLPVYKGTVKYKNEPWKLGDTGYSINHGMFYLPEERRSQGILADLSVSDNISISALDRVSSGVSISKGKEKELAAEVVKMYDIKTPTLNQHIKFLSGGNQQKVIIGRAMVGNPSVLIFDEPTKGIDVGAKTEIYRLMKKIAEEQGAGIILISSEMNELMKCSNRIISLHEGEKMGEFDRTADKGAILSSILGLSA